MKSADEPRHSDGIRRKDCQRFIAIFVGLVGCYYALMPQPWVDRNVMLPILQITAKASSSLLNLAGATTTSRGAIIQGPAYAIAIRQGCDPAEPIMLFGAAVIPVPAPWWRKIVGVVLGACILFGINLTRIATLYAAGRAHLSWFETLHQEWWPAFFVLAAVLMWIAWLQWAKRPSEENHV